MGFFSFPMFQFFLLDTDDSDDDIGIEDNHNAKGIGNTRSSSSGSSSSGSDFDSTLNEFSALSQYSRELEILTQHVQQAEERKNNCEDVVYFETPFPSNFYARLGSLGVRWAIVRAETVSSIGIHVPSVGDYVMQRFNIAFAHKRDVWSFLCTKMLNQGARCVKDGDVQTKTENVMVARFEARRYDDDSPVLLTSKTGETVRLKYGSLILAYTPFGLSFSKLHYGPLWTPC